MFECPGCGGAVETTSNCYFCKARSGALSDGIRWECSGPTVWIATRRHEFVGMVELHSGRFVANDTLHATYRTYNTLSAAKQALEFAVLAA
jgi:hypothetical protein